MAKDGPKIKLTPELREKIIKYIEAGNYAKVACHAVGISESTYYRWKERGKKAEKKLEKGKKLTNEEDELWELWDSIRGAEARAEIRNVISINLAGEKDWRAALEMLARKYHKRWGIKKQIGGTGEEPIKVEIKNEDLENQIIKQLDKMRERANVNNRKK